MNLKEYVVTGFAMVPVRVTITVKSRSPRNALINAKRLFRLHPSAYVDARSEDYAAAHDWQPHVRE